MSHGTVLHLFGWDKKFVLPFRDFIHEHFADGQHQFIIYGDVADNDIPASRDTLVSSSIRKSLIPITRLMNKADKIIIHGLFNNHLLYLLALQPWVLQKCYWVIWGGDLYVHNASVQDWRWRKNEAFRHFVIKRIGHCVTYVRGDYELAQRWYGTTGKYHHCLMYPSNVFKVVPLLPKQEETINILVGNSADATNNHAEVFEQLLAYIHEDIQIFCPLSYGPSDNAQHIAKLGRELFGDKFLPLLDFIPLEEYSELLGQIDIAVFAHKRQQAMGNIITLLGLGKKVFMRRDITSWAEFTRLGLVVFDVSQLDVKTICSADSRSNSQLIADYFSERSFMEQYREVFR